MNIEEKLQNIDFSKNSKIKNVLLSKLLNKRKSASALSMEELDMVVAAGNNPIKKPENNLNKF